VPGEKMARTRKTVERVGIRIPKPMTDEMKRIIEAHPELCYNRQQFVESAIREKIERIKMMERPPEAQSPPQKTSAT